MYKKKKFTGTTSGNENVEVIAGFIIIFAEGEVSIWLSNEYKYIGAVVFLRVLKFRLHDKKHLQWCGIMIIIRIFKPQNPILSERIICKV